MALHQEDVGGWSEVGVQLRMTSAMDDDGYGETWKSVEYGEGDGADGFDACLRRRLELDSIYAGSTHGKCFLVQSVVEPAQIERKEHEGGGPSGGRGSFGLDICSSIS